MHLGVRFGALGFVAAALAGCQQMPRSAIGPSAVSPVQHTGTPVQNESSETERITEGFDCSLDGVGLPATDSRLTISGNGKAHLVCSGPAFLFSLKDKLDFETTGLFCQFGPDVYGLITVPGSSGYTTRWKAIVNPDGKVMLTCKSD